MRQKTGSLARLDAVGKGSTQVTGPFSFAMTVTDEGNGSFVFSGKVSVDEVRERLNVEIEREGFETVGGFLLSHLGRMPYVGETIEVGDLSFEVPFSFVDDEPAGCVLRGTIDCLARRPDGSVVVLEFKTGAPSPAHEAQLAIYCRAARTLLTETVVTGRVVYPTR